jgi:hypothetical protein
MEKETEPTAQADGKPSNSDSAEEQSEVLNSADEVRRFAAEKLCGHLAASKSLLEQCENLAAIRKGDRFKSLFAAARLMSSGARVAEALATVAKVERIRRTIIERVQPPAPQNSDLNSILEAKLQRDLAMKMLLYMKVTADESFDPVLDEAYETMKRKERDAARSKAPGAASDEALDEVPDEVGYKGPRRKHDSKPFTSPWRGGRNV